MKKVMVILTALCLVSAAQADLIIDDIDPTENWIAWANVYEADGTTYLWGSSWGLADVPASFETEGLTIQPNTNCYNAEDSYWVNTDGSGNKTLEMNVYYEISGLADQDVTFNYNVLSNTLSEDWEYTAFIKVLDPDSGWATVQSTFADLTTGTGTLDLTVGSYASGIVQIGFLVKGLVVDPASAEAATSVVIEAIPEPATLALLGLGGLLLRRKK